MKVRKKRNVERSTLELGGRKKMWNVPHLKPVGKNVERSTLINFNSWFEEGERSSGPVQRKSPQA